MPSAAHEVTEELSDEELKARLYGVSMTAVRADVEDIDTTHQDVGYIQHPDGGQMPLASYRFYDPLPNAADDYIAEAKAWRERMYTGIDTLDTAMRGIGAGELMLIVGFAHSSKTVLVTEFVLNNRRKRIAWFTPDETRVLILIKLVSIVHDISAEVLEQRICDDDLDAIEMVRSTAREHFPNLAVFDQSLGIEQMGRALDEVESAWGEPAQAVIFDYADLLAGFDDVRGAITALKTFGKNHGVPMIVLHQSSRSAGADGKAVTISSGGYGGEQQATFLIGVRRKKSELLAQILDLELRIRTSTRDTTMLSEQLADARYQLSQHQDTATVSLLKNKRPPSRLVDEIDFHLNPDTGRLSEMHGLAHNQTNRDTWEQESF